MGIFDSITKFINPSLAIGIVRTQLEKQLKKKVPFFDLLYIEKFDKLNFIIDGETFFFDNDVLKNALKNEIKKRIKDGQHLDIVKVAIDDKNKIKAQVYYTDGEEKKFINLNM